MHTGRSTAVVTVDNNRVRVCVNRRILHLGVGRWLLGGKFSCMRCLTIIPAPAGSECTYSGAVLSPLRPKNVPHYIPVLYLFHITFRFRKCGLLLGKASWDGQWRESGLRPPRRDLIAQQRPRKDPDSRLAFQLQRGMPMVPTAHYRACFGRESALSTPEATKHCRAALTERFSVARPVVPSWLPPSLARIWWAAESIVADIFHHRNS